MTEQVRILTEMMGMSDVYEENGKKYLTNDVNPFYKGTLQDIKDDLEYAKECYEKVFMMFANSWFKRKGCLPPKYLFVFEI